MMTPEMINRSRLIREEYERGPMCCEPEETPEPQELPEPREYLIVNTRNGFALGTEHGTLPPFRYTEDEVRRMQAIGDVWRIIPILTAEDFREGRRS